MNASSQPQALNPEASGSDCGIPSSVDLDDESILFAAHSRNRIGEFERQLRRPLIVAFQGVSALHAAASLAGCSAEQKRMLPETVAVPVCFRHNSTAALEIISPERRIPADRDLLSKLPQGAQQVVVSLPEFPQGREFVALTDERRIGGWTQLALADLPVFCCSGELTESQVTAIERIRCESGTRADLFGSDAVLLQVAGGSRMAGRNYRTLAERKFSVKVFTTIEDLQELLHLVADWWRCTHQSTVSNVSRREANQLLDVHRAEQAVLNASDDDGTVEQAVNRATRAEGDCQRGSERVRQAMDGIEQNVMLALDQHLQSGGPIMEALESLLEDTPLLSLEGWETTANKLNEHLTVLAGVFVAEATTRAAARVRTAIAESFPAFGPYPDIRSNANLAGMFDAIPNVNALSFWNSVLSGGIKGLISERMSSLGTKYLPRPVGSAVDKGLAVCTATLNLKKTVTEDLRTQLTLHVMPAVSSIVSPAIRSFLREMNQVVYEQVPEFYQSYVSELQEMADRCRFLRQASCTEDTTDLRRSGIADMQRSETALKTVIAAAAEVESRVQTRLEELQARIREPGRTSFPEVDARVATPEHVHPSLQQQTELRAFVSGVLQNEFKLSADSARAVATEIIPEAQQTSGNTGTNDHGILSHIAGVDVCYERQRSRHWERRVRLFFKSLDDNKLREVRETKSLEWTDLPDEVRDACLVHDDTCQRFVLYPRLAK